MRNLLWVNTILAMFSYATYLLLNCCSICHIWSLKNVTVTFQSTLITHSFIYNNNVKIGFKAYYVME